MNPLYGLMLFGVAFFGLMVIVGVVQARRKKEKAYFISAFVSFLMLLSSIFVFLNLFALMPVLLVAIGVFSVAGLPSILKTMREEPLKQLRETDLSSRLKVRDFLTWKGWFKLTSKWGVHKTLCLYGFLNMLGVLAFLLTLSIFGMINIVWAIGIPIGVGVVSAFFFYFQIRNVAKWSGVRYEHKT